MRPFASAICLAAALCGGAAAADVHGVSANQKVTPQQAPEASWSTDTVAPQCARTEWEALQVVVRDTKTLEGVSITLSDLRRPQGAVLPAKLARLHKVEWVDIAAPYELDRPSPGPNLRPDPLVPIRAGDAFALEAGRDLVFGVALNAPRTARPDSYSDQLKVSSNGQLLKALPAPLRLRSFALPGKPFLLSMVGFAEGNICKAHGCTTPEDKERIIRLYFDEHRRARLSPLLYAPGTRAPNPLPDGAIRWEFVKGADGKPTGGVKLDFADLGLDSVLHGVQLEGRRRATQEGRGPWAV